LQGFSPAGPAGPVSFFKIVGNACGPAARLGPGEPVGPVSFFKIVGNACGPAARLRQGEPVGPASFFKIVRNAYGPAVPSQTGSPIRTEGLLIEPLHLLNLNSRKTFLQGSRRLVVGQLQLTGITLVHADEEALVQACSPKVSNETPT
jgi:hypothetical protein